MQGSGVLKGPTPGGALGNSPCFGALLALAGVRNCAEPKTTPCLQTPRAARLHGRLLTGCLFLGRERLTPSSKVFCSTNML